MPVAQCSIHKHLGMYLAEKLNFGHRKTEKIAKANKSIGIIKKLHNVLTCRALLTIYICFIRPNLDYGDFIYDHPNNDSFCNKIESVQYNAALAITGAIRGTSLTKLYNKLGLESLTSRQWFRYLCTLHFFFNWDSPHGRLNSHHKAWSYKKKKHKKDYRIQKICLERTYS